MEEEKQGKRIKLIAMTKLIIAVVGGSLLISVVFIFGFNNPTKAEAGYDLKADSLSLSPASPELNTVITITAKVKNLGDEFILSFPLKYTANFDNYTAEGTAAISPDLGSAIRTNDYITRFILFNKIHYNIPFFLLFDFLN